MKKKHLVLFLLLSCSLFWGQNFPVTKAIADTSTKFNIQILDDYSWMENMKSDETNSWVNAQNEAINLHYKEIKKQYNIATKIKEYSIYSSNGLPSKREAYYYSLYTRDKSKPSVLYYRKDLNDDAIELFNPYKIYNNTTSALSDFSPSKNSKYVACKVSLDGSDRMEIRFVDILKNKNIEDKIDNVKFSRIVWNQDSGVFYKRNVNENNFAKDSTYQLYYHRIGTTQNADKLIFDASKTENNFTYFTKNDRLFIVELDKKTNAKTFYFALLSDNEFHLEKFITNDKTDFDLLYYNNNKIYFSGKEFDWGEIRTFDISNRTSETLLIPQIYNNLLVDSYFLEGYIFCKYRTINKNYLIVYDEDGKFLKRIEIPEGTDFDVKFFDSKSKCLYISIFSKTISYKNFKLNIETGEVQHFYNDYIVPKINMFDSDHFITKKISFKSRDGKEVPITIIYKKDTVMDGNNPTLLEAYGGFGVISELNYDTGLLYFLEKGGVYVFAEIRGGGEKGLKWHKDGMGLKKQNSFNDFIDAAEFLINEKYTSSNKLAITGGSNGGLVVGVAMTQRPELFKVAIPRVGVFDMNKFNNYTVGDFWMEEYGNPKIKEEFESLLSYSPYHNIKEDINYPISLIITSENDDRVVPMHSYKFAARLQNRKAQKNPIYLKTLDDSGHSGKKSNFNTYFEEKAFFYSFLLYHLNKKDI
ncbi:MAG: prolyl oligopeptidase family serine peptidase [Bacteroidota bacterium]